MGKKKSGYSRRKSRIFVIIGTILTLLCLLFNIITPMYEVSLRVAFRTTDVDERTHLDALEAGYALNVKLEEEGIVLLRNEGGTLPIEVSESEKTRVNVFGLRSAHMVLNSAGSASGSNEEAADLKQSLEEAGFEVNPNLWRLLSDTSVIDNSKVNEGGSSAAIVELPVSGYTGECSFESAKQYSDYAIVTFSRLGGEGSDQARTGYGTDGTMSYLELSEEEKALLAELEKHGFITIVLVNSSYAMELGPLEDYNVAAALWIGGPGVKGALAIGAILAGAVNPSGRLVDTYAYDLSTASTFITSDSYSILGPDGDQIGGYTDYAEGIYYGYRWYETAAAEGFWNSKFAAERWGVHGYEEVVQYPFGYGLSYTSFEQGFSSEPQYNAEEETIIFHIETRNTGNAAGKNVIQLYAETPYVDGGLEMSKVVLVGYEKTGLLKPGDNEHMTITLPVDHLASYDATASNGDGAYSLLPGEYRFYLADGLTGAHCWANASDTRSMYLNAQEYSGDSGRSSDKTAASNHLTEGAVRNGTQISILSRKDGFANAEETIFADDRGNLTVAEGEPLYEALVTRLSKAGAYQGAMMEDLTTGAAGDLTLSDLVNTRSGYSDYNDPRWEQLIDQMSLDDLITLCGTGGWSTAAIASIGKEATEDIDGPYGLSNLIKNNMGIDVKCVSYCTEVVMASTWNRELVQQVGEAVAAEAMATGTSGWYAPGANTHRTPFGGRNPEYYSEDPYLGGTMCASEVNGALENGLYVYVKHFGFNDTEANRVSMQNCYMDEQTAREIYLKPFEIAIKNTFFDDDGRLISRGATGLMVSYMWFEEQWVGADYSLMTTILRDEWGFQGMVITDNAAIVTKWITFNKAIFGGTDLMLVYKTAKLPEAVRTSGEGITALKTSAKHILWTIADAASRRTVAADGGTDMWSILYIAINVVLICAAVAAFALAWIHHRRMRNQRMEGKL